MRFVIALFFFLGLVSAAQADVHVVVDRTTQRVTATINGTVHVWKTSTGLKAHWTPPGTFGVQSMDADHYSSIYDDAPMPHSCFLKPDQRAQEKPLLSTPA
jgi:lipoprotein-anchoring transpeptidase ErfK/SrfK